MALLWYTGATMPRIEATYSDIIRVRVTPEMKRKLRLEAKEREMQESDLVRLKLAGKLRLEVLVEKNA